MSTPKLPMRAFTREEMMKRVSFYEALPSFTTGFSDASVPNTLRRMSNVMGFRAPPDGQRSPVGSDASRSAAIDAAEGFNLAYVRCTPGNGPLMHNHDTSETFVPMSGRWRCSWNEEDTLSVDIGPWDVVSFPPGAARRFENITEGEPDTEHVLMVIVGGNAPMAETTDSAKDTIAHWDGVREKEKTGVA